MKRREYLRGAALAATAPLAGCSESTPEPSPDSDEQEQESGSVDQSDLGKSVQFRISYAGDWTASVGTDSASRSINGPGTKTATIDGDPQYVSAVAQKRDDGPGTLSLEFLVGGEVRAVQETTASYGVVRMSSSLQ